MSGDAAENRRLIEAVIKVEAMGADIAEIKASTAKMADAINKLALIEERQTNFNHSMDRAFTMLEKHDTRLMTLELAQPLQKQTSDWVGKFVSLVIGAVLTAVLALVVIGKPATTTTTSTRTTTETPQR